ncbi:MAG: hypothetical protein U0704_00170 [Candidatus Eisenbacteria bacterium]
MIPVSVEVNCVSSELPLQRQLDPQRAPARGRVRSRRAPDPVREVPRVARAGHDRHPRRGYFSFRIHDQHKFLDSRMSGVDLCNKCHPGPKTQCLRGAMSQRHALTCRKRHGNMSTMAETDRERSRAVGERAAVQRLSRRRVRREPRQALSHEHRSRRRGVRSLPQRHACRLRATQEANDNANNIALQGYAGVLRECAVCHGDGAQTAVRTWR